MNSDTAGLAAGAVVYVIISLAFAALMIASMWLMFTKAGQPGWAAIIPIFNVYTLLKVVGRPGWWLILYIIPIVDVIVQIIVCLDLARSFGKGGGFALGLIFLPFIFYPVLGFGRDRYVGPAAA
jgi:hypothetical protein